MKREIEGEIVLHRTEPRDTPCICCGGGPHIYGREVKIEGGYEGEFWCPPEDGSNLHDWLNDMTREASKTGDTEGKRVRVTFEVLD